MYKTFAKHLLAIAFVIYLIAAVITALLRALAGGTVGILLGTLVSVIAAFVLQATLVKAVQDIRDGQADMSIGQTVSSALPSTSRPSPGPRSWPASRSRSGCS